MQRSFTWGMIAILAIVLAPFAGVLAAPATAVRADVTAPAPAPKDDEIIAITPTGQVVVDDPTPPPAGYVTVNWSSASVVDWEYNWSLVAGGDFNGDGDAEIVAARATAQGSEIKVFDPVVQPGKERVDFSRRLGDSGYRVSLLVTGNFDTDVNDEFALINYIPGSGMQAALQVFDGGPKATFGEWTRLNSREYSAMFVDMSVGDFNNDGVDDLVMVRNTPAPRLVTAWNVRSWADIAENSNACCDWLAVAGGNLYTGTPGDEVTLSRAGDNQSREELVLFKVVANTNPVPFPYRFEDLVTNPNWRWDPNFPSVATGNLDTDLDDEIMLLRDPGYATTSLLMVNPAGTSMNPWEQPTGYGQNAFKIVRMGDTDGDSRDEVVLLKGDKYRIYTEPKDGSQLTEKNGLFYTTSSVSNLPFMALANVDGDGILQGPVLTVTPISLTFRLDCGDTSPKEVLNISNSGGGSISGWQAQAIEDQAVAGGPWLLLDAPTFGAVPGTLKVSVRPGIAKGNYTGKVRVTTTDPAVQTVDVPVSYAALCSGFVVSPDTLNFNVAWGTIGSQPVAISGPGPTAWNTSVIPVAPTTSCSWLTLGATTGTTPTTVNVSANSETAGVGLKSCYVIFSTVAPTPGSPQVVTVNLTVPDPGFVVRPTALTIRQRADFSTIVRGQVKIERPNGGTTWQAGAVGLVAAGDLEEKLANGQATVTAEGVIIDGVLVAPPAWLVFTPGQGDTPATMMVSVAPNTPLGTYRAVITILPGDKSLPAKMVDVTAIVANSFTFLPLVLK